MTLTVNGVVQTKEATIYVPELDSFVTVILLYNTPAVLSLGKVSEEFGESYHWTGGLKQHSIKYGKKISLRHIKSITFRGTWFINGFLYFIYFSHIFIAGNYDWHGKSFNRRNWDYEWESHGQTRRVDLQKPQSQIEMKMTMNYELNCCMMCLKRLQEFFFKSWCARMFNHINTHPSLHTNYLWNREQKWCRNLESTVSKLSSSKDRSLWKLQEDFITYFGDYVYPEIIIDTLCNGTRFVNSVVTS